MRIFIDGVGVIGPGLSGWQATREVLVGAAYQPGPVVVPQSDLLPAAERRRTGMPVKMALAVGYEAFLNSSADPAATSTVFTSSGSDGDNLHAICETVALPVPEVSPTRFHNSVHNAAAGYWSIAMRSQERSTSLCCFDGSFAAGLLESCCQVTVDRLPVGLIAYDLPYPEPLSACRRIPAAFGLGLVLMPEVTERTIAALDLALDGSHPAPTRMTDAGLEALRAAVPAARGLTLLAALARGSQEKVIVDYLDGLRIALTVTPWK